MGQFPCASCGSNHKNRWDTSHKRYNKPANKPGSGKRGEIEYKLYKFDQASQDTESSNDKTPLGKLFKEIKKE